MGVEQGWRGGGPGEVLEALIRAEILSPSISLPATVTHLGFRSEESHGKNGIVPRVSEQIFTYLEEASPIPTHPPTGTSFASECGLPGP